MPLGSEKHILAWKELVLGRDAQYLCNKEFECKVETIEILLRRFRELKYQMEN